MLANVKVWLRTCLTPTVVAEEGRVNRAAMEEAAWQSHLETLVKCPTCPRTFLPDRLTKHQRACRGEAA